MQSIFVSSTFADMQRERDSLRDIVSPAINSMARKYNDHVEFCDLRWGINTEDLDVASASRKVLDVCLDEVDRSNPPMVILLGDRYGWIPDRESVRSIAAHKQFLLNDYRKSVMAIEAEFGAIFRKKKTLVYIRNIDNTSNEIPPKYRAEDDEHRELLASLKHRLKSFPNCLVRTYTVHLTDGVPREEDLTHFSQQVTEDLTAILQPQWERFSNMSEFERERERQWAFVREKNSIFSARAADADHIFAELANKRQIIACKGPSGSGKSSLCSNIAVRAKKDGWDVLPFIGGLTSRSSDGISILKSIVYHLENELHFEHFQDQATSTTISGSQKENESISGWQDRLRSLSYEYEKSGRNLLVIIDAVDQLFPDESRDTCAFIPRNISRSLTYFITALPDFKLPTDQFYVLHPLAEQDRRLVVDSILHRAGKELSPRVTQHLLSLPAADNPYYISMVVHRLCLMESGDFEEVYTATASPIEALTDRQISILDTCPDDLEGMAAELFEEASRRFGAEFLTDAANLLAMSRFGLRRNDLASLLGSRWNELSFSHFLNYLYEDFQIRTDGRIDFMHKTMRSGLRKRIRGNRNYDKRIASYLNTLDQHEPIRMRELPYHLIWSEDADGFISYIRSYELGDSADAMVIEQAAKNVKDVCVEDDGDFMQGIIIASVNSSDWTSILWFVVKELVQSFGFVYTEETLKVSLLIAVKRCIDLLDSQGKVTERNRDIFLSRIANELVDLWEIVDDAEMLSWAGEEKLKNAKKKYGGGNIKERKELFNEYYRTLFAFKGSRDKRILLRGAQIAEEGLQLLDEELLDQISGNCSAYYGCTGEIFARLNDRDKCLEVYLRDLDMRKRVYERDNDPNMLGLLAGAYLNVAQAHAAYEDRNHYAAGYDYALNAVSCIEQQKVIFGGNVSDFAGHIGRIYQLAGMLYFVGIQESGHGCEEQKLQAIRYVIEACEQFRVAYRMSKNPDRRIEMRDCWDFMDQIAIPTSLSGEVISSFEKWLSEDERDYIAEPTPGVYPVLVDTCFFAARAVYGSSMYMFYEFALKCCERGLAAAESSLQDPDIDSSSLISVLSQLNDYKEKLYRALHSNGRDALFDDETREYGSKILQVVNRLHVRNMPVPAQGVNARVLQKAISSYAPDISPNDIVAISGAKFPSNGRVGVLYTSNAIYSSFHEDGPIVFSDIESLTVYDDGLQYRLKNGSAIKIDYGPYQDQVYQIITSLPEGR